MNSMNLITRSDILSLREKGTFPAISIFMPTHQVAHGVGEDRVVFRNLLRAAEKGLSDVGVDAESIRALLNEAREREGDGGFWRGQAPGLAFFISPDLFRIARLPAPPAPLCVVGQQFSITPILPMLSPQRRFLVLALNRNDTVLYDADHVGMRRIDVPGDLPRFQDFLETMDVERDLQFTTGQTGSGGGRSSTFFGRGSGEENIRKHLPDYFRILDGRINQVILGTNLPLVLAGIDYVLPIYREISHYPRIVKGGVGINPADMTEPELWSMAWEVIEPLFQQKEKDALEQLRSLAGTGRTSTAMAEIVKGAEAGRVQSLFVDLATRSTTMMPHDTIEHEGLLNHAMLETIATGGEVIAVSPGEIYDNAGVAAIFRY